MALFDPLKEGRYQKGVKCRFDSCSFIIRLTMEGICKTCMSLKYEDNSIDGVRFSYCATDEIYKPLVLKMPRLDNGGIHTSCNHCRNLLVLVPSEGILRSEKLLPCPTQEQLGKYLPEASLRRLQPFCSAVWQSRRGTGLATHFDPPAVEAMVVSAWGRRRRRSVYPDMLLLLANQAIVDADAEVQGHVQQLGDMVLEGGDVEVQGDVQQLGDMVLEGAENPEMPLLDGDEMVAVEGAENPEMLLLDADGQGDPDPPVAAGPAPIPEEDLPPRKRYRM